jgi:2'-5' RNA ligase
MMNFRDFIIESEDEHKYGTYISVTPNKEAADELYRWTINNNIPNPIDREDLHCTLIYSRKGIPAAKHYDLNLPINATTGALKIFNQPNGKDCLVVTLNSEDLVAHHETIMNKYGAVYDHEKYIPHITLSYNIGDYKNVNKFPKTNIVFDDFTFEALDEPK